MATIPRPQGAGLYATIHLPRANRIDDCSTTYCDRDNLPAQLDPQPLPTANQVQAVLDRRLGNGYSPAEVRRINEADRGHQADLRDVAIAYLDLVANEPTAPTESIISWTDNGRRHSARYVRPAATWSPEALDRLLRDVRRS